MRVLLHVDPCPPAFRRGVIALGNFDGVHRGHQAVLAEGRRVADELDVPLGVLSFEPHPRAVLNPEAVPFRLTNLRTKACELAGVGVDFLVAHRFDTDVARMLAQDFVEQVVVHGLGAVHLVMGADFCFGRGRSGTPDVLRWMGEMEGFGVTVVPAFREAGTVASSTEVRRHLREGRPEDAARLLGHWWHIEARVEQGDRRGRTIGFPTANLSMAGWQVPALGVYAVRARLDDGRLVDGVANIGRRPTFDKPDVNCEAHLFDFAEDLYGRHLCLAVVAHIRGERRFGGLDELKAQIAADSDEARRILADLPARAAALGLDPAAF